MEWEFGELSERVNFVDLTIFVENEKISAKTFRKAMNLYQHLSPRSNHHLGMIKGIVDFFCELIRRIRGFGRFALLSVTT